MLVLWGEIASINIAKFNNIKKEVLRCTREGYYFISSY